MMHRIERLRSRMLCSWFDAGGDSAQRKGRAEIPLAYSTPEWDAVRLEAARLRWARFTPDGVLLNQRERRQADGESGARGVG